MPKTERRRRERRFAERRRADHPVFLETRLPLERRASRHRRRAATDPSGGA